ncbi:hypothetical protein P3T18_006587 [Paraburkholderia sp. GAS199]
MKPAFRHAAVPQAATSASFTRIEGNVDRHPGGSPALNASN